MAIDTKAKRQASFIDIGNDGVLFPDGSIANATDRANQIGQYFASTSGAVAAPTLTIEFAPGVNAITEPAGADWDDITSYCQYATISRGRQQELDTIKSGTLSLTLNNKTRLFDPFYAAGTYYGQLLPNVHIRVKAVFSGTTYYLFRGFVNGWPQKYPMTGKQTEVTVTANDAFKVFAKKKVASDWEKVIRRDKPLHWWRMEDNTFTDQGFLGQQYALTPTGTFAFSTPGLPNSDNNGVATFDGSTNYLTGDRSASIVGPSATFECWINTSSATVATRPIIFGIGSGFSLTNSDSFFISLRASTEANTGKLYIQKGNNGVTGTTGSSLLDGVDHHIVVTFTGGDFYLYVDGVFLTSNNMQSHGTTLIAQPFTVGYATYDGSGLTPVLGYFNGKIDEICWYNSVLADATITEHYNAGAGSYATTNKTGTRIGQVLDNIDWPTANRDIDTGVTSVGTALVPSGDDVLSYLQLLEKSEYGILYMTGQGYVRFVGRQNLLTEAGFNTSNATFGDDVSTEKAYSDIAIEYDDQLIYNEVECTRSGGLKQVATDTTSASQYFLNAKQETGLLIDTDLETRDRAFWILSKYKDPIGRITPFEVKPYYDKANLFPQVLNREIGERVIVKRRPHGGTAITLETLIEGIDHHITPGQEKWVTTYYLSPANTTTSYLIVGDTVYGKVGTGKVAY